MKMTELPSVRRTRGEYLLTAEDLREMVDYDPATGLLTWKVRIGIRCSIGGPVGRVSPASGYVIAGLKRKRYPAHRLAWLHQYGEWPTGVIDHINGVRTDNRIANLRDVNAAVNNLNVRKAQSNSTTGLRGVTKGKCGGFVAQGKTDTGEYAYLGTYTTAEEAHEVYTTYRLSRLDSALAAIRQPDPGQQWKCGDEFLPFHPQASHVPPEYRDGWNRCYWMAAAIREQK